MNEICCSSCGAVAQRSSLYRSGWACREGCGPVITRSYSLDELRAMTSVELRAQLTNSHELVRARAQIELDKRDARRPARRVN